MRLEALIDFIGQRKNFDITKKRVLGYTRIVDAGKYSIYRCPKKGKEVIAAYQDLVVFKCSDTKLEIVPNVALPWVNFSIKLTNKYFPGLLPDSKILGCQLIPYLRFVKQDRPVQAVRLCLFTDKGQIYHNYPDRSVGIAGFSKDGDIKLFEESVVWDLPERKYPSMNKCCAEVERYFPYLPNSCYDYHPILNTNSLYIDRYGNGGFGVSTKVLDGGKEVNAPRFYIHSRNVNSNPFHFMGGCERDHKMTIIGTYRSNVDHGVRTCIFATDDGGRQWFCKYEFGDLGTYSFQQGHTSKWGKNFGNELIARSKLEVTVSVKKRNLILWGKEKFLWEFCGNAKLLNSDHSILLEFNQDHNLVTGNIICLENLEPSASEQISPLFNNSTSSNSAGTGVLFKVEVIDLKLVRLYEYVASAYNNIPCRHIHHINPAKDGWFIGTGEIYPNGWLLYFQKKQSDTYQPCKACDEFNIIFLNHKEASVQRTMGLIVKDDDKNTVYYASDHDILEREPVSDMFTFSRSSNGVYRGILDDIDDRNKFECIYELMEPCYFFQKLDSMILISGQRGELVLTDLNFSNWYCERLDNPLFHYYGKSRQMHFFDRHIIIRKDI